MAVNLNPAVDPNKKQEDVPGAVPVKTLDQQASGGASAGVQSKPAVSGGFTNLSKYMSQIKNAGQQLTGRLSVGINRDVGTSVGQTKKPLLVQKKLNKAHNPMLLPVKIT